jgi:AraC-like DNA-binding protein
MLLRLGASGVRQVVDVTSPAGWNRLRQVVGQPATRAAARIQQPILESIAAAPPDARLFLEAMIRLAPEVPTVTALAGQLSVRPSTLMSRFARAGLPSPKNYLAAIRLLHAAFLFETAGLSVADVAYRLEYSSPQSFGRHLRAMLGLTALEFRRRFPFPVALERFVRLMMEPYWEIWRGFHPLAAGSAGGIETRGSDGEPIRYAQGKLREGGMRLVMAPSLRSG